eukprot:4981825-Amphidinium_carterae.1
MFVVCFDVFNWTLKPARAPSLLPHHPTETSSPTGWTSIPRTINSLTFFKHTVSCARETLCYSLVSCGSFATTRSLRGMDDFQHFRIRVQSEVAGVACSTKTTGSGKSSCSVKILDFAGPPCVEVHKQLLVLTLGPGVLDNGH